MAVVAPAGDSAVPLHPASVVSTCADRGEDASGWRGLAVVVVPPAGDGAVAPHPACVTPTHADGGEDATGRRRPAMVVVPPAGDGAVAPHPASMVLTRADRGEGPAGRRRLAFGLPAPASNSAVGPYFTGVTSTRGHTPECSQASSPHQEVPRWTADRDTGTPSIVVVAGGTDPCRHAGSGPPVVIASGAARLEGVHLHRHLHGSPIFASHRHLDLGRFIAVCRGRDDVVADAD